MGAPSANDFARKIVDLMEDRPSDSAPAEERAAWHEAIADVLADIARSYPTLARDAARSARRERAYAKSIRESGKGTS